MSTTSPIEHVSETQSDSAGGGPQEPKPPITDLIQLPAEERMQRVIDFAFGGSHRVNKLEKFPHPRWPHWQFNVYLGAGLATEDGDQLTRLVVASLQYGVRAEFDNAGPRFVKVRLHPRSARTGCFSERIRTVADQLNSFDTARRLARVNAAENWEPAGLPHVIEAGKQMRAAMQAEIEAARKLEDLYATPEQFETARLELQHAQRESQRAQHGFELCCSGARIYWTGEKPVPENSGK